VKTEKKGLTIAIDGPSGAGKSTAGRTLAKRLGYTYIDTGAMYRAVALKIKERGIELKDESALYQMASSLHITFVPMGEEIHIYCNGEDVSEAIRLPEISRLASEISKKKGVREALVEIQREMAKEGRAVMEGRDIGTVVFPEAEVKFYLDADPEERAKRRFQELMAKGIQIDFRKTLEEVLQRDHNDMHRAISPLKRAEDSILIDSTHRSVEEVVEEMLKKVEEKRR
jgi:cytidylate kinase